MSFKSAIHVLSRAALLDQDHVLVCKTLDLAKNFYFLPGGHIEHEESAEQAVLRELLEEANAHARIKRLLGCLEHTFEPGHNSICHNHEYNFIFEAEADSLTLQADLPQMEENLKLEWIPLDQLSQIDFRPEPLRGLLPEWLKKPAEGLCFHRAMK